MNCDKLNIKLGHSTEVIALSLINIHSIKYPQQLEYLTDLKIFFSFCKILQSESLKIGNFLIILFFKFNYSLILIIGYISTK